jgi:tetratricopeptide (TPR) repeat protein
MMPGEEISYYKKAAALDPNSFDAQYNLGVSILSDPELSIYAWQPLQKALDLEKRINLVDYVVRDQQLYPVSHLTRLPTTESLEVPLRLALAKGYCEGEHYERAIQEYKQVLSIERNNPAAPWGLCFTYRGYRRNFKHLDALNWERRAQGTDFLPATLTGSYMPEVIFNYFGMLR